MELRHVRAFVAVAEELHFGRAAARLRLSPSPVSRTIAELEREIGAPLFVRGHHSIALTDVGAALLEEAQGLLRSWSTFLTHGRRRAQQATRAVVRMGAPTMVSAGLVDRVLEVLATVCPDTPVDVRFASSTELLAQLTAGDLDVSIMLLPVDQPAIESVALARYDFCVALREDDDLAGLPRLTGRDLVDRRVLVSTNAVQQAAVRTVGRWLTELGAVVELLPDADLIHVAHLVRRGRGLTLSSVSGPSAQIFAQPGLTTVPLDCPAPGIDLVVAWQPGPVDPRLGMELTAQVTAMTRHGLLRT